MIHKVLLYYYLFKVPIEKVSQKEKEFSTRILEKMGEMLVLF